jgi:DNA-binding transcriptional MerR regulator
MKRIYYSIGEVSELLGEKQSTLRYWESEFSELSPRRSSGGRRIYTESDVKLLKRIQYYLHKVKYSIEGARRHFKQREPEIDIIDNLERIKRILEE